MGPSSRTSSYRRWTHTRWSHSMSTEARDSRIGPCQINPWLLRNYTIDQPRRSDNPRRKGHVRHFAFTLVASRGSTPTAWQGSWRAHHEGSCGCVGEGETNQGLACPRCSSRVAPLYKFVYYGVESSLPLSLFEVSFVEIPFSFPTSRPR